MKKNILLLNSLFTALFIISNILATKLITIWWFNVTASVICYPLTFLVANLITENEGKLVTKRVIINTIICQLFITILTSLVVLIPSSSINITSDAFNMVFSNNIRIVIASIISFYVSQRLNIYLYNKFKKDYNKPYLSLVGSTILSLGVDILIFISISFIGRIDIYNIIIVFISQYLFQLIIGILLITIFYILKKK